MSRYPSDNQLVAIGYPVPPSDIHVNVIPENETRVPVPAPARPSRSAASSGRNSATSGGSNNAGNVRGTSEKERCVLLVLGLVAITGFTVFLYFELSEPEDYYPKFKVQSMLASPLNLNLSTSQMTANWTIEISVKNHNKNSPFDFNYLEVLVFYRSAYYLAQDGVAPFRQAPSKNETTLIVQPFTGSLTLRNSIGRLIAEDMNDGEVSFDIELKVQFIFISGDDRGTKFLLVVCEDLKVGFPANRAQGAMVGGSRECTILEACEDYRTVNCRPK